ncbi:transcriptional regulator [Pseudanabaena sp. FACHB-1998]|uniref:helix-turn-helix domain-containing protein n=1 Tax=Pseudanabaena sp. FACHB-1998 TaxID=2692858 RepID=UPI0018EFD93F|nr:transcriptional regulator [Pseudanabaena sp. FACHB-1998]
MSLLTEDVRMSWGVIRPLFSIRNESDYDRAIERLNGLIDEVGTDEQSPLYELLDTLGIVLHTYEEKHYSIPDSNGVEMMQFLMEEHQLGLADLPEVGTPEMISAIINGQQDLSVKQLKSLSKRFQVSPEIFI